MKKFARFIALALCCVLLTGCAGDVTKAIDAIGTVTLASGPAIAEAEKHYKETPGFAQRFVDNYQTLVAARTRYEQLVAVDAQMMAQLNALPGVDAASGDALSAIRKTYEENVQTYAPEKFAACRDKLESLEKTYRQCLAEENLAAAQILYGEKKYAQALELIQRILQAGDAGSAQSRCDALFTDCQKGLAEQLRTEAKAMVKKDPLGAIRMLESIDSEYRGEGEYKKILDSALSQLKKNRPSSGKVLKKTTEGGTNVFKLSVKGSADFCVKLEDTEDSSKFVVFYARAGQPSRVKVPSGTYKIKFCTGDYWCDLANFFYPDSTFVESRYTVKFASTQNTFTQVDFTLYDSSFSESSLNDPHITPGEF